MKVLIIEDDPDLSESVAEYLSDSGGVCEAATTFETASRKIWDYEYDCVVLDITLPDGDNEEDDD